MAGGSLCDLGSSFCDLGLGHAYCTLISTLGTRSSLHGPSDLPRGPVQAPMIPPCFSCAGPLWAVYVPGHLWLRALVPVSPELLATGSRGRMCFVPRPQSHLFPPDPPNPLPPFGSLLLSPSRPSSQRHSHPLPSHFLVLSWEEGLSHSLTHWHIHPTAISCAGWAVPRVGTCPREVQ